MTIKICMMDYVIAMIRICCNIKLQWQTIQLKIDNLFLSVMSIKAENRIKISLVFALFQEEQLVLWHGDWHVVK